MVIEEFQSFKLLPQNWNSLDCLVWSLPSTSKTFGAVLLEATFLFFNVRVAKLDKSNLAADSAPLLAARASNIILFCSFTDKSIIFSAKRTWKELGKNNVVQWIMQNKNRWILPKKGRTYSLGKGNRSRTFIIRKESNMAKELISRVFTLSKSNPDTGSGFLVE